MICRSYAVSSSAKLSKTVESSLFIKVNVLGFWGYPYPPIYVPTKVELINESSYIILQQTRQPQNYVPSNKSFVQFLT